jgi:hypothetical protein
MQEWKRIRNSKVYVSGARLTMGGHRWIVIQDEDGYQWALVPYSDKTNEEHVQAYADANKIVKALNEEFSQ